MLLEFSLKNFMSIRDIATINFITGRERLNSEYLPYIKKMHTHISQLGCIFGPNASGKTNLFKALSFIQRMVLTSSRAGTIIPVQPFRLDAVSKNSPTFFKIVFIVDNDDKYIFMVELDRQRIIRESLSAVNSQQEKLIYDRKLDKITFPHYNKKAGDTERAIRLKIAIENTPSNQLFLNVANEKIYTVITECNRALNWFKQLVLITPDTSFLPISKDPLRMENAELLSEYGTGIDSLTMVDIPREQLPKQLVEEMEARLTENQYMCASFGRDIIIGFQQNSSIVFKKLCSVHRTKDKNQLEIFDLNLESDGAKRILELSPVLYDLAHSANKRMVFVIDELDRSLHTILTQHIIKKFIKQCNADSRSQLIFTCHDQMLIDRKIFRQDQMWVTSKNEDTSTITKFSDFEGVRTDMDLRTRYMNGQFGGIPKLPLIEL